MLAIQSKGINTGGGKPGMPDISNWPSLGQRPTNNTGGYNFLSFILAMLNGGLGAMTGGVGSTLLSLMSTLMGNSMNQQWAQQQQQAAWNQEQKFADQAFQRQLKMIEKYQTPKAIIKQLKDAGLSPGLMYSKSGAGTIGTGSINKGNAGMGAVPMMGNPLSMLGETLQLKKLNAELENIKADTEKKEAETSYKAEETKNLETINKNLQEQINTEIANIQSETDKNKASEILIQNQAYAQKIANEFREVTFWTEVEGKIQETENAKKLGNKMEAEIKEIFARINNLTADNKLKTALMQQAMSEMLLANQRILTEAWNRQFSKNMAIPNFGIKMQEYKQALQNTYTLELENSRREIENTPFKLQWQWWQNQILGLVQQGVSIGSAIIIGKGLGGGAAVKTGKTLSSQINHPVFSKVKGKGYNGATTTSPKPLNVTYKSYKKNNKTKNWNTYFNNNDYSF